MTRTDVRQLKSRQTLKKYFSNGCLPTERHFHALIDSMLNMQDEGFRRTDRDGLRIAARGGTSTLSRLLSFFPQGRADSDEAPWQVGLDRGNGGLQVARPRPEDLRDEDEPATDVVLALSTDGHVGVRTAAPRTELDVDGTVRMVGRVGTVPVRGAEASDAGTFAPVLADGAWHSITGQIERCCAFEVVAGVRGKKRSGQYALLYALAIGAYNPPGAFFNPFGFNFLSRKNRIRVHQAYYRSRRDKLELRWHGEPERFSLQIRSRRDYGPDARGEPVRIDYHVTDLWPESVFPERSGTREPREERARFGEPARRSEVEGGDEPATIGSGEHS